MVALMNGNLAASSSLTSFNTDCLSRVWGDDLASSIYGTNASFETVRDITEERDGVQFFVRVMLDGAQLTKSRMASDVTYEPWEVMFYVESKNLTKSHEISPYLDKITEMLWDNDFIKCDRFLSRINAKDLSNPLLTGLLRLTSKYREHLPHWQSLRLDVEQELQTRGLDVARKLRGL